jgi:hypothetical protein
MSLIWHHPWYKIVGFGDKLVLRKLHGTLAGHDVEVHDKIAMFWWFAVWWLANLSLFASKTRLIRIDDSMLIRLTPKHTIGSLAAETRCRHARRCLAPRGSALSGFTARVPTPLS